MQQIDEVNLVAKWPNQRLRYKETIYFLRKSFRENNDIVVKFFVGFGTLCWCVLLADNNEI